ncbi:MAG: RluA family pseudouridine synthase [Desulfobacteraceae bacterium]|nr:RluA family pseudouridine synthase [Desulfobacteraceae bacterium]
MAGKNDFTIHINEDNSGKRLDIIVASLISCCSRSFAANLIRDGKIQVQGEVKKPGYRLKPGDEIFGSIPPPEPVQFEPEPVEINTLYEDRHIIVINKAPGIVVHPAPGHYTGTLVNGLLYHFPDMEGIGGKIRPGIVHRLDKDTSGTLVVAKNDAAHENLSAQFKSRSIKKEYLAVVHGEIKTDSGVISFSVGRHNSDRKKMSAFSRKGRPAETVWKVRERFHGATLLHIDLKTGRTHQIRVHCAAISHPIVGDDVYCSRKIKNLQFSACRQMLHAWRLELTHPVTGEKMGFESPLPHDMDNLINILRTNYK